MYTRLARWQEDLDERYGSPLQPRWYGDFVHFNAKGIAPWMGNFALKPDIAFNDLIELNNDFEVDVRTDRIFDDANPWDFVQGTVSSVATGSVQGPLRSVLTDSSPMVKVPIALTMKTDPFSGEPIPNPSDPLRETGLPEVPFLGEDRLPNSVTTDFFNSTVGRVAALIFPGINIGPDKTLYLDHRVAYSLEQLIPLWSRMVRLAPNNDYYRERVAASWLGFISGGARQLTDRDRLNTAFDLTEQDRAVVDRLRDMGYIVELGG